MEILVVYGHIAAGALALFLGALAMLAHKGGARHRLWGKAYFWSMFGVFSTSLGLLVLRPNAFLLGIAVLSFYGALTGYRALFRKQMSRGWRHAWLDWIAADLAGLASLGFIAWGTMGLLGLGLFSAERIPAAFSILGIAFGLGLGGQARVDLRSFRRPAADRRWWWFYHMERLLGSYIAALTAFTVQVVGRRLPLEWSWLAWVAPGLIGGIGISLWIGHYREKFAAAPPAQRPRRRRANETEAWGSPGQGRPVVPATLDVSSSRHLSERTPDPSFGGSHEPTYSDR